MYVPLAMNSFRISFWMVPRRRFGSTPCFLAIAIYIAIKTAAGALIVMLVETRSKGISRNKASMSSMDEIETPTLPPSPVAIGSSASYPIWVGKSKATDKPV